MNRTRLVIVASGLALSVTFGSPANAEEPAGKKLELSLGTASLTLAYAPPGRFVEGSPASEKGHGDDETARTVTLSRGFYIGVTPVTVGQYRAFVAATGYRTEAEKGASGGSGWDGSKLVQKPEFTWKNPGFTQTDLDPVVLVTFADAEAFNGWATTTTAKLVRLATEAEWEYAARAGAKTAYFSGETALPATGWFKTNAGKGTKPTGKTTANGWGLFDVSGNVNEWTSDWNAPRAEAAVIDPRVTTAGTTPARRVLKGGSWNRDPLSGRAAARYANTPGSRNADNGFRVVVDPSAPIPTQGAEVSPAQGSQGSSASTTPATSTPAPSSSGTGAAIFGLGIFAFFGLLVLGFIALVVRFIVKMATGGGAAGSAGFVAIPGNDGFTLRSPRHGQGTRVRYEAVVRGVPVTDVVVYDGSPNGMFVYTGGLPQTVRIVEVVSMGGQGFRGHRPRGSSGGSRGVVYGSMPVDYGHQHHHHHHHHENHHGASGGYDDSGSSGSSGGSFGGFPSAY